MHINIVEVLKYFDKFTEPGDYICVEDTNPLAPNQPGQGLIKELGYTPFGHSKLDKLKEFMKTHSERYLVDQLYTDLFGWVLSLRIKNQLQIKGNSYKKKPGDKGLFIIFHLRGGRRILALTCFLHPTFHMVQSLTKL